MKICNTGGYFKDLDDKDLGPWTPRVLECNLEGGKFTWPQVKLLDGSLVRIAYRCFTEKEKTLYKQYRGRPCVMPSETKEELTYYNRYSLEDVITKGRFHGVGRIDDTYYDLVSVDNSDIMYVPIGILRKGGS